MNIFSDFHHSGLYNSLQLLFEDRLGYTMFRPIGMQWYKKGYWNIYPSEDTAKQYLSLDQGYLPKDGTVVLNKIHEAFDECFVVEDKHHNTTQKALTFETFMDMPIDIVIASIPQHIKPFKELAAMKGAKFIFQMGNVFPEVNLSEIPNLMANTLPENIPPTCHYIQYHQEISPVFKPSEKPVQRLLTSFINIYQNNGGFSDFMSLKAAMPDYEFKSYGGQCIDGTITGVDQMAAIMQQSAFGFHSKYGGDGFGHVLYDWFACGKPVITRISDYKGKLGEELLKDGVTCIDLDKHSIEETKLIIENMKPLHYIILCQNVRDRFEKCVDYQHESEEIKEWLKRLN